MDDKKTLRTIDRHLFSLSLYLDSCAFMAGDVLLDFGELEEKSEELKEIENKLLEIWGSLKEAAEEVRKEAKKIHG